MTYLLLDISLISTMFVFHQLSWYTSDASVVVAIAMQSILENDQRIYNDKEITKGPIYWHWLTFISAWISNYIHYKVCEIILLIHSQTSTVQPLKFGNG